ncbi:uncharacterized protein LOC125492041 [Beta vulgaris subsp. vulgaris]|uniref:uncharacterized protein LOC125492041 n=1 Tax=Beta vulgaris subsp. vulgaris TaxID=3555 RepID=UPI002548B246|nr:uncharacterized protein LOC125492041 [Beta vulgaris subsp. vulgaris]
MSESFYGAVKNMNSEIEKEPLTLESDEEDDAISTTQSRKRPLKKEVDLSTPLKKPKKLKDFKDKGQKKLYEGDQLVASLHSVSTNFSTIFENISANLATMASTWSKAEEREQQLDEKVNKILEEVMKLEGVSPSEALEAATILMAHEHKLKIFYQAPVNLKKQYILDLLRKKIELELLYQLYDVFSFYNFRQSNFYVLQLIMTDSKFPKSDLVQGFYLYV